MSRENGSLSKMRKELMDDIKSALPRGSGFNNGWDITKSNGIIHCKSRYDSMNDVGMYDRAIDFTVNIPKLHQAGRAGQIPGRCFVGVLESA